MVITLPRRAALDSARPRLEAKLEQEYEGHTERLAFLMARRRRHRGPMVDLDVATADARQSLADVAVALRRMAEGSYGTCERCHEDIDLADLEASPASRHCAGCAPSAAARPA